MDYKGVNVIKGFQIPTLYFRLCLYTRTRIVLLYWKLSMMSGITLGWLFLSTLLSVPFIRDIISDCWQRKKIYPVKFDIFIQRIYRFLIRSQYQPSYGFVILSSVGCRLVRGAAV